MCRMSVANARVFGYPASRPGTQAAFPKVRLVLLTYAADTFNCRCLNVSVPHRGASKSQKVASLSDRRNVTDVGQRTAFVSNGTSDCCPKMSLLRAGAEERQIRGGKSLRGWFLFKLEPRPMVNPRKKVALG